MTTPQLASKVVAALELPDDKQPKTASYLERLERGADPQAGARLATALPRARPRV